MLGSLRYFIRTYGRRTLVGVVLTALFALHVTGFVRMPLLDYVEYFAYDLRLNLSAPGGVDRRIVIVDVDEKSLAEEGRWPWSRTRIAQLVDNLFDEYGVRVVGFDMVFAEPERSGEVEALREAARRQGRDDVDRFIESESGAPDQQLAASLAGRPVALGYYFNYDRSQARTSGRLPEPLLPAEIAELLGVSAPEASGFGANLPELQQAAVAGGFFDNPLNDDDGVFRRIPLIQQYQGSLYSSLGLVVSEIYTGSPVEFNEFNDMLLLGGKTVPVDADMAALIPYRGPQGSFPYVSASDVLSSRADRAVLADAIVLIGTTAPGLFDLRNTPVQKIEPGVERHAILISGILDGRFLSRPPYTVALELLQVAVVGLLLSLLLPLLGPTRGSLLALGLLLATLGINAWMWFASGSVLPLTATVLLIVLHYTYIMSYGFLVESRNKKALMTQFGRYVPEEIVDEMSRDPGHYSLEGERRELTVMFSDVRGFTAMSESLEPQEVTRLMNEYLSHMTGIIHHRKGTIDKFIGDAIMAFWGAPLKDPLHAGHAVAAALAMADALPAIHREFAARGWPQIRIGIGLNTGIMAVGNMGSDFRMAYTVMGDAVNLCSRIESLTKQYGVTAIVTEHTARAADTFCYRPLDRVRVRGRREPLDILEPLCRLDDMSTELGQELELHAAALERYRGRDFSGALGEFDRIESIYGRRPLYDLYRDRIARFAEQPPPEDWEGVHDHGA